MRPVFANSAWVRTRKKLLVRGQSWEKILLWVRYGLFTHPVFGPVLIDTGYTQDSVCSKERSLALKIYSNLLRPQLNQHEQPEAFLALFNLKPEDISVVLITHFHPDHISGLSLFRNARFITIGKAWQRISSGFELQNVRHGIFRELIPDDFVGRMDALETKPRVQPKRIESSVFREGWDVFNDNSLLAIPLPGHANGHFGLLFENLSKPLLYAVDTQWLLGALEEERGASYITRTIVSAPKLVATTTNLVSRFKKSGGEVILCHDPNPTSFDLINSKADL